MPSCLYFQAGDVKNVFESTDYSMSLLLGPFEVKFPFEDTVPQGLQQGFEDLVPGRTQQPGLGGFFTPRLGQPNHYKAVFQIG